MELRTAFPPGPIIDRLRALAAQSTAVRAAIAFWTVDADYIGADFTRCLAADDAFLCVDIHLPTSIEYLAGLVRSGVDVHLHLYDLAGNTEDVGVKGLPPHLMHAKMMLFERRDDAVLWVGSHNATRRSWEGPNLEASLELVLDRGSEAYVSARHALDRIRARCDAMRLDLLAYYHWLQKNEGTVDVISVEDPSCDSLENQTISIFGTAKADYSPQLQKLSGLYLAVTDPATGRETPYHASILQTGVMESADRSAGDTRFDDRRYAFREGATAPVLLAKSRIPQQVYSQAHYFVTLRVLEKCAVGVELAGASSDDARWTNVVDDPLLVGSRSSSPRVYTGRRGDRAPRLRRAVSAEDWRGRTMSHAARAERFEGRLVSKRLLLGIGTAEAKQGTLEL